MYIYNFLREVSNHGKGKAPSWYNFMNKLNYSYRGFIYKKSLKGKRFKQTLFRLSPYRLFHGELDKQDKAQHSSVGFNLLD